LFPFVGYLILVNDEIAKVLEFHHLIGTEHFARGLSAVERLRLIYYALFFLGVSNFIYRLKKPYSFRFGPNVVDYTKTALELFNFHDYVEIHGTIRHEGHLTPKGNYYDSEWEGFEQAATNKGEGTEIVVRTGSWEEAKSKYGSLLRSMLRENFFRHDTRGRPWLTACVFLSTLGYVLLAIPSIDLFIKVSVGTLGIALR
jgi:hypothetical protein